MLKFEQLFSFKNKRTLSKLAKYITLIMKTIVIYLEYGLLKIISRPGFLLIHTSFRIPLFNNVITVYYTLNYRSISLYYIIVY